MKKLSRYEKGSLHNPRGRNQQFTLHIATSLSGDRQCYYVVSLRRLISDDGPGLCGRRATPTHKYYRQSASVIPPSPLAYSLPSLTQYIGSSAIQRCGFPPLLPLDRSALYTPARIPGWFPGIYASQLRATSYTYLQANRYNRWVSTRVVF